MIALKEFDRALGQVVKADSAIKKCILVDRTGLTIAHVSRYSASAVDVDGIGAIASAVFCASEEQGRNLDIGELLMVSSEFDEGKIFAASCGRGVLCVITDPEVNIGLVRLVMKKATDDLKALLQEFLAEKPIEATAEEAVSERAELEAALKELEKF